MKRWFYLLIVILILNIPVKSQIAKTQVLAVRATPNDDGTITFSWDKIDFEGQFFIYRQDNFEVQNWGFAPIANLPHDATSWIDHNAIKGKAYEYRFAQLLNNQALSLGYLYAGNKFEGFVSMGKVILLIDSTYIEPLDSEIQTLIEDMTREGWIVITTYAGRNESVTDVKARIDGIYNANNKKIKALFILGHVPVPYSGTFSGMAGHYPPPDGHVEGSGNHTGAWPADVFYGIFDGVWTDKDSIVTGGDARNHNIPNDGKYDQAKLPASVQLEIGRVDLYNLPSFSESDTILLKNYLHRNHSFRIGELKSINHALIDNNFGSLNLASTGYHNFSTFFADSVFDDRDYFEEQRKESYLWSYGCGAGSYNSCAGIGVTKDFTTDAFHNIFTILAGSFFGDWDVQNSFLRSPLAAGSLECFWGGIPKWYVHHMALGLNIGYGAQISQNNNGYYFTGSFNYSENSVHIALMGDPTLKMKYPTQPSNLAAVSVTDSVKLTWDPSPELVDGYNVYVINDSTNEYTVVNPEVIKGTEFKGHINVKSGKYKLAVRAVILDTCASGSYYEISGGPITAVDYVNDVAQETGGNGDLVIYPSISSDFVNIRANMRGTLTITDITGRKIIGKQFDSEYIMDISNLDAGIYFITINDIHGSIKCGQIIKR